MPIAALYVATNCVYFGVDGVDPWDEARDARLYAGPHAVVAHPPCQRWGRYWSGGPMLARTSRAKKLGDDGGCFAQALACVRVFGGVLEHPEASHAWRWFGLTPPKRGAGWQPAGDGIGWTCCVEQGHFGHAARKATWLYAVGCTLPELPWGSSGTRMRLEPGFHSREERRRAQRTGTCQRLSSKQRAATPPAFAALLIAMAQSVRSDVV